MGGYPNSWMVYFREDATKIGDLGVPLSKRKPANRHLTSSNHSIMVGYVH